MINNVLATALDILKDLKDAFFNLIDWSISVSPLIAICVFAAVFFFIIYTKLNPAETLFSVLILVLVWVSAMPTGFVAMKAGITQPGIANKARCIVDLTKSIDYWISKTDPASAKNCAKDKKTDPADLKIENHEISGKDSKLLPGSADDIAIDKANAFKKDDEQHAKDIDEQAKKVK